MKKIAAVSLGVISGIVTGGISAFQVGRVKIAKYKELDRKNNIILSLYNKWMYARNEGKTIADYLKENNYKTVAIYGMHYLGENLLEELIANDIEVLYAIDRNADKISAEVSLYRPEDELPGVDAIIVTAFYYFDEIQSHLQGHVHCPVLSIEDLIYEML